MLKTIHTHISHFWGSSLGCISGSGWICSVRAIHGGDDGRGLPVWLVKVDVTGSSPVCKYRLLCDETVVASSPISLVRKIHGALVGPRGLIVMIWYSRMGGGSTQARRERRKP